MSKIPCAVCGAMTEVKGPRQKYCPNCSSYERKRKTREAQRQKRDLERNGDANACHEMPANMVRIVEVNRAAKAAGLTYGQYLARRGAGLW